MPHQMPTSNEQLAERIECLEHTLKKAGKRRWRERIALAAGASLCSLALVAGIGAKGSAADVVRTKRLEVVDDLGNIILLAGLSVEGGQLDVWNSRGKSVVRIGANSMGGDLKILHHEGGKVMVASATDQGGALSIMNTNGKESANLATRANGGRLSVSNDNGKSLLEMRSSLGGGEIIGLTGSNQKVFQLLAGETGGTLSVRNPGNGANLVLNGPATRLEANRKGARILNLSATEEGGRINLSNQSGNTRVEIDGTLSGGRVMIHDNLDQAVVALGSTGSWSGLRVRNTAGAVVVAIGDDELESGVIEISHPDGQTGVLLAAEKAGGHMVLSDPSGIRLMEAGPTPNGGRIEIRDARNQIAAELFGLKDGGGRMIIGAIESKSLAVVDAPLEGPVTFTLTGPTGRLATLAAAENGGLLDIRSTKGRSAVVISTDIDTAGGSISLRSEGGGEAVRIGPDAEGRGEIDVFNPDGSRKRTLSAP